MSALPDGPFGRLLTRMAEWLALMGACLMLALMLVESLSVMGRALSGWLPVSSIAGDTELVQMGGAVAIFAFLPYCHLKRGNVFVDFFSKGWPLRLRSLFDAMGNLLFLAFTLVLVKQMALATHERALYGDTTTILRLPEMWSYGVATALAGFLSLSILYALWRNICEMRLGQAIGPQPGGAH